MKLQKWSSLRPRHIQYAVSLILDRAWAIHGAEVKACAISMFSFKFITKVNNLVLVICGFKQCLDVKDFRRQDHI